MLSVWTHFSEETRRTVAAEPWNEDGFVEVENEQTKCPLGLALEIEYSAQLRDLGYEPQYCPLWEDAGRRLHALGFYDSVSAAKDPATDFMTNYDALGDEERTAYLLDALGLDA